MVSDYWHSEVAKARAAELADVAAMDRLARHLARRRSVRREAQRLGRSGPLSTLARWMQRRLHVPQAT